MSTDEDLQRVAEQMRPHVPELVERIQRRLRAEVPQFFASADPGLAAVEAPAIADSLNDILDGLAGGLEAPKQVPAGAMREAQLVITQNMRRRNQRPSPVSAGNRQPKRFDAASMTEAELRRIDERLKRGEKVRL